MEVLGDRQVVGHDMAQERDDGSAVVGVVVNALVEGEVDGGGKKGSSRKIQPPLIAQVVLENLVGRF